MTSPSQLFSNVDAKAVLDSPVNDSSAKNLWTFNKDSRFKKPRYYCDNYYNIPGVKENKNRSAAFGYGKKTDLDYGKNPEHVVPPPNSYKIDSFVDLNKKNQKGFTPKSSRNQSTPMSYIQLEPTKVPGPGRYDELRFNETPKFTMRPKTSHQIFPQTTVKIVPGPGTYENQEAIDLNLTGKYHLSKNKNQRAKVWNPPRSQRFNKSITDAPGPGNYKQINELSNEGKYILSRNISAGKRTFMEGRRLSFTEIAARRSFTPGPGNYRKPSDFGYYDSKQQRTVRMSSSAQFDRIKKSAGTDRTGQTTDK